MKRRCWTIEKLHTGERVGYSNGFIDVDENHVRTSPSVKAWAGDDEIVIIPETFNDFDDLKG